MKPLHKEDVILIAGSTKELDNPRCLIVIDPDRYNWHNQMSFLCLDVTNGFTYRVWLIEQQFTKHVRNIASRMEGIRILGQITTVYENDEYKHLVIYGVDLEHQRELGHV
jgi:hypothetical protein